MCNNQIDDLKSVILNNMVMSDFQKYHIRLKLFPELWF